MKRSDLLLRLFVVGVAGMLTTSFGDAQTYSRGQNASPAFEGWEQNADGSFNFLFGYMDNSPSNKNVPDPRNWQGSGNRSVANMFIDLGMGISLTDEQFQQEMMKRREQMKLTQSDVFIGCPLCNVAPRLTPAAPVNTAPAPAAVSTRPPGH